MGISRNDMKYCGLCLTNLAVTECSGCLRPLCKKCRNLEIWRTPDEEVSIRSFCPQCRDNPEVNPQGKGRMIFGLGEVTDMVNHEQGRGNRFKIKLKIS